MKPRLSHSFSQKFVDDEESVHHITESDSLIQERIRIDGEIIRLQESMAREIVSTNYDSDNDDDEKLEEIKYLISRSSFDFDRDYIFDNMIGPGRENFVTITITITITVTITITITVTITITITITIAIVIVITITITIAIVITITNII